MFGTARRNQILNFHNVETVDRNAEVDQRIGAVVSAVDGQPPSVRIEDFQYGTQTRVDPFRPAFDHDPLSLPGFKPEMIGVASLVNLPIDDDLQRNRNRRRQGLIRLGFDLFRSIANCECPRRTDSVVTHRPQVTQSGRCVRRNRQPNAAWPQRRAVDAGNIAVQRSQSLQIATSHGDIHRLSRLSASRKDGIEDRRCFRERQTPGKHQAHHEGEKPFAGCAADNHQQFLKPSVALIIV